MPKSKSVGTKTSEVCQICTLSLFDKTTMIIHLLGKKHRKKAKYRYLKNAVPPNRSIRITGLNDMHTSAEKILSHFYSYGIIDCFCMKKSVIIEFFSEEEAKRAIREEHIVKGIKLDVRNYKADQRANPQRNVQEESNLPPLSPHLQSILGCKPDNPRFIDSCIISLMKEIQLNPGDIQNREELRAIVENFLSTTFPNCEAYVFGSSANNLGFSGCDVDMVVNLKVPIWEGRNKAEGENEAALITRYIAKEIRLRNLGYKIIPISRARVPIVKFIDCYYHLHVDLSFKNGMPIHNTRLIKQYTMTHPIVKPYLMLLRYWAKAQMIAGGGQPKTLLTNYCLCMLMLFWLMIREQPIVPCVGELQGSYNIQPIYIDGWNCSFSEPHSKWKNAFHEISILDLTYEFFRFYSNLDSGEFVISPLQGSLIPKEDINHLKPSFNQHYLRVFYNNKLTLQLNTPLCVQDPFELSHNIARGFDASSMSTFQAKCKIAVKICQNIKEGKASLSELFEEYKLETVREEMDISAANIVEMVVVDSDNSKDSVELEHELESLERIGGLKKLFTVSSDDVEEISRAQTNDEIEVISEKYKTDVTKNKSSNKLLIVDDDKLCEHEKQIVDDGAKETEEDKSADSSVEEIVFVTEVDKKKEIPKEVITLDDSFSETHMSAGPNKVEGDEFGFIPNLGGEKDNEVGARNTEGSATKNTKGFQTSTPVITSCGIQPNNEDCSFKFQFSCNRNFKVTNEGHINFDNSSVSEKICLIGLWRFILKCILKCYISDDDEMLSDEFTTKRKSFDAHDELSSKFLKKVDGESISVDKRCEKINKFICNMPFNVFQSRKIISKDSSVKALSPLQYEVAVSNIVEKQFGETVINLKFEATLWKDTAENGMYWITFNFDESCKTKCSHIINRLPLFCQNIMRHAQVFLKLDA